MSRYRKALVAALGVAALFLPEVFTPEASGAVEHIFDGVVALLTVFGVFQVKNEPQPPRL